MNRPYIVYNLSKGRTTQKFRKSKIPDITKDIEHFLECCTTTNIQNPASVELNAYSAFDESDPVEALEEIIKKTTERFGLPVSRPLSHHYPSGVPDTTTKYTWTFSKDRLQEVIEYLIANSPLPKSNFGPLDLIFHYGFKLINPINGLPLQNHEFTSMLLIWFSRNKCCSPILYFPFEKPDESFWEYVDSIMPYLPFHLEEKYLRLAQINKKGEVGSFRKIQRTWQKEG